ncbi:MAG: hypothetical protein CMJ78_25365 [Planctomycetaceae bacterium]|nr:hypothetical protein [Planctomycetaceae bacterium]
MRIAILTLITLAVVLDGGRVTADDKASGADFFEKKIRPLLIKRCYECHSEKAGEQQGGLLLDRRSGWIKGGNTEEAILPAEPNESLLIKAVRYGDEKLQMPPEEKLPEEEIRLLIQWVRLGAPGPRNDLGDTSFSRLGDQEYLFQKAKTHWAYQPIKTDKPPTSKFEGWDQSPIDQFVAAKLEKHGLNPSNRADARSMIRRLSYDLTGLPPSLDVVQRFAADSKRNRRKAIEDTVEALMESPAFGEHFARLWLDVARYGDTDGAYRPDTRTPHYFPWAFSYRDYVVESFNQDRPIDDFIKQQLAADLMGVAKESPEIAALGFLTTGPHANRNQKETVDDWIDVTTRGLMGITVACARCHDHKYEPVPTADYYSLHGIFSSVVRVHPLDEHRQPLINGYEPSDADRTDYESKRAAIDKKIKGVGKKKAKNNNRSIATKIRETELAQLLLFHPGAPARAMIVIEKKVPVEPVIFIRGQEPSRGEAVPRRFLQILDSKQEAFPADASGRLQLAEKIVDPKNPLTSRVFINRIWGYLMGSHLVATPSDFGLQGETPSHPRLLDWLPHDFVSNGWSLKRLVRQIVMSRTYQQASRHREDMADIDP